MSRKKKIEIPTRPGKPTACVCCGSSLHRKSEHYCSPACEVEHRKSRGEQAPAFLSKWKIRKRKELEDPLIVARRKLRRKTTQLIKSGRLHRKPCVVCGSPEVVPHHEDYSNPFKVIWLCEDHHSEYHDGKIALDGGRLRWDPIRLTRVGKNVAFPEKKYCLLRGPDSGKVEV